MYKIFFLLLFYMINHSYSQEGVYEIDYINLKAYKISSDIMGNEIRGKKIFISRKVNCLSCHKAPINEEKFQGNFGPSLQGVGERYSKEELRLIIINSKIINPSSIMPAYFEKINYPRTPKEYYNKTILSSQEVEDIVEYIYTFK